VVFIHIEENGLKEILADEIMGKIEMGDSLIEYQHVFIKGDLNISELSVPKDQKGKLLVLPLICIKNSVIKGVLNFSSCSLKEAFILEETTIKGAAYFDNTDFNGDAYFVGSIFEGTVHFWDSTFRCADFSETKFMELVDFSGSKFSGENLSFESTVFASPLSQEDACRRAKIVLEANGDREKAGSHFYREMEGKRKRKTWYIRYPEWFFIQFIFGYGVHPFRLMACWFGFVGLFAAIYLFWHGIDPVASQLKGNATLADYVWFSIATAVTPGYAGYKPTPDFKLVAGLEAIIGTFMWAAFIATFSRKYMR